MTSPLAVTPFLVGDPVRLGEDVTSFTALVAALDVPFLEQPGLLELAPGVALIHALTGAGGRLALRWVHLPHAPRLIAGGAPIETALVLTAPITESANALRVAARLMSCVQDATRLAAARAAAGRGGRAPPPRPPPRPWCGRLRLKSNLPPSARFRSTAC